MSYYCDICDKTIKMKSKKKHLLSKFHNRLYRSIVNRYCIKNPEFFKIEDILKKHVDDYRKDFECFVIICEWKLVFDNNIIIFEKTREHDNTYTFWNLILFLLEKKIIMRQLNINFLINLK